ncbi:UDP-N-acetylglucosamine--dolichyl-phosphate N-acetylglucosaminephosphotransferase [Cyberlindnera fabianii]|uniref:UDP-N-acetylglucosamine--dolichyl-phosphate N-acetylglucosaminephosphotransferase n=1 Tax=Cyberlindnera fabianii TaxID=36022 RepID=A0A1V2L8P3_CYBFA|nr:UDP-N-acetylglucosamine--dolichyl-phosphate N-acetylglucosaminephosphotransferase [Cyberlindnera fabianii]
MSTLTPLALAAVATALVASANGVYQPLQTAIGFAIYGYVSTDQLIPKLAPHFTAKGLFGKDLSKKDKPIIPETIGAVSATAYLFIMFFFIPFMFYKYLVTSTAGGGERGAGLEDSGSGLFPHDKLAGFLSAILCLESILLLGLADDFFDLRWRHKFFLPAIAAIPMLVVYYVDFGITHVLIPTWAQSYFAGATTIELGWLYYAYMGSVAIFCPNSINILAGVNGLETGQSVVLTIILLLNDTCYLISGTKQAFDSHLFSACLLIPFLGVSLPLFKYNWWPAQVFVGDTYCYFAGMVFGVVGIQGHFSKTLLLFFLPQIFNFCYSVPQLFNLVPCPRHRLPRFNAADGLMYPSHAKFEKPLKKPVQTVMYILAKLKLLEIVEGKDDSGETRILESSNWTLINLALVWFGPMREDKLCATLLTMQFAIGVLAIIGRHTIGPWLFGYDNLWVVQ